MHLLSINAISWLQEMLNQRLHSELRLHLDVNEQVWKLRLIGNSSFIEFPIIPSLYKLGIQPHLPCAHWNASEEGFSSLESYLPAPGLDNVNVLKPLVHNTPNGFEFGYDIFGLMYWMLARCEEVDPPDKLLDKHSRFSSISSHAYKHGYLDRPVVDEWIDVISQLVSRLCPQLQMRQTRFKVVVSHDVDLPSAYAFGRKRSFYKRIALRWLKNRNFLELIKAPYIRRLSYHHLHPSDPYNTFDWLMDRSEANDIRSSFNFICGRSDPKRDAQYEPDAPNIRALMRHIHSRGHEIGLHPSYNTYKNPLAIVAEASRLRRIAAEELIDQSSWGGRMHVLRWKWPTTAYGWEMANFQYDSTLGYADTPGFRCGTCHPYRMFDPVANYQFDLIQHPLIVMECSVTSQRYLNLGFGIEALDLIKKLRDRCAKVNGNFTLLWHNNNLNSLEERHLYESSIA